MERGPVRQPGRAGLARLLAADLPAVIRQPLGDPHPVQVLEQRDDGPPRRAERHSSRCRRERLVKQGQDLTRPLPRARRQHDLVSQPQ